jgi:hypothetical protein
MATAAGKAANFDGLEQRPNGIMTRTPWIRKSVHYSCIKGASVAVERAVGVCQANASAHFVTFPATLRNQLRVYLHAMLSCVR